MRQGSRISLKGRHSAVVATGVAAVLLSVLAPTASAGIQRWRIFDATGTAALSQPLALTADDRGNVYVADTQHYRIVKFDPDGGPLIAFGQGTDDTVGEDGHLYYPGGIAFANDNVYVADGGGHQVQVFTTAGNFVRKWGTYGTDDGQFILPQGVAADCAGNVYVTDSRGANDSHGASIQSFTSSGTFLKRYGVLGRVEVGIGVAVAAYSSDGCNDDFVFVADEYSGRIAQYRRSDASFVQYIGTQGRGPMQFDHPDQIAADIDTSGDGSLDLWVAESGTARIQHIKSTDGGQHWSYVEEIDTGVGDRLNAPHGVAVDRQDNVLVAETGASRILEYRDVPPNLQLNLGANSRDRVKRLKALFFFLSYNQLDKSCNTLLRATVTVPPHAAHVFTIKDSFTVDDGLHHVQIPLSDRQVGWVKEAWHHGHDIAVVAKAAGDCTGRIHLTDKTDFKF